MQTDLLAATQTILREFEATWTHDLDDLRQPSTDQVVRNLILKRPKTNQTRLEREFFATGPLDELITDDSVVEIVVNGENQIWYEQSGEWLLHSDHFLSEITFRNFVDRLCVEAGIKVDLSQPFADGRWRGFRVHLTQAPLTHCRFHITLRRLRNNPWTLDTLCAAGWCSEAQRHRIEKLLSHRQNVIVLGPTGSGKTTVLGACLKALPENERVVILEDTDELHLPNSASTKLLARPPLSDSLREIPLSDLVKQSLRMRPHRLVVGEVRGAEAKDLLLALATGHSGSWGTLHAAEARQALLRLEMMIQLGAPQWSITAIRQLLHLSVDALLVCANDGGRRRLDGVFRVAGLESVGFLLEPIG